MSKPIIYLCVPTYDRKVDVALAFQLWQLASDKYQIARPQANCSSLLANGFNRFWCEALNARATHGVTHFVMVHADIVPASRDWLEILVREMEAHKADLISGIVAIKDGRGVTSTAWHPCKWGYDDPRLQAFRDNGTCPNYQEIFDADNVRMLMIDDLPKVPKTFDRSISPHDDYLLVNTGLWLADLRSPMIDKCWFEIRDWKVKGADGNWKAKTLPEDWHLSMQLQDLGGKVMATQLTPVLHFGSEGYLTVRPPTDPEAIAKIQETMQSEGQLSLAP